MLDYMIRATFQGVFGFPPTCFIALISLFFAGMARHLSEAPFRRHELLLGLPLFFTVWLILHGTLFAEQDGFITEPNWKTYLIELILLMHLAASGFTIWLLEGLRVYATLTTIFLSCFVMMAAFEASMSVTNIWV